MELGAIHALLVSRAQPPDIVVGVSAGAVNAVALAEVLQAGRSSTTGPPGVGDAAGPPPTDIGKKAAQVARFRYLLDEYQHAFAELVGGLVPDPYQVDAQRPLEPLMIPIHDRHEREERNEALRSKSGLINLANDLVGLRLSIGAFTRIVRRILAWRAAAEIPGLGERLLAKWNAARGLWVIAVSNLLAFAPIVWRLATVVTRDRPPPKLGASAGALIFRWRSWKVVRRGFVSLAAVLVTALSCAVALLLLALAPIGILIWLVLRPGVRAYRRAGRAARRAAARTVQWARRKVGRTEQPPGRAWGRPSSPRRPLLQRLLGRLLRRYAIADGLFSPHALRSLFVRLFDRDYYGTLDFRDVLERAARYDASPSQQPRPEKLLSLYARGDPPIHVGVVAADVSTGALTVLPTYIRVVDALQAATAVTPLFPPVSIDGRIYVDGVNVANEPLRALLDFLREDKIVPGASVLQIYPVALLPLSRSELGQPGTPPSGFVGVALRAWELKRFRDATLERRVTDLYTRTMGAGAAVQRYDGHAYLRARVYPIEPEAPLHLNERLARATDDAERQRLIAEAVADGCRAALQTMIQPALREAAAARPPGSTPPTAVSCRSAVGRHLASEYPGLPGSDAKGGPGVVEVCRHCAINRGRQPTAAGEDQQEQRQALRVPADGSAWSSWPRQGAPEPLPPVDDGARDTRTNYERRTEEILEGWARWQAESNLPADKCWPRPRDGLAGKERPLVSLLFSGGVFRGVFQIGVLNALNEVGIRPDLVAGASVGSITAALAAQVFAMEPGSRHARIAQLAATYLVLDRLVITDRFADFIRLLTLRAAATPFSPRQADRLFRQYDRTGGLRFVRDARLVLAGLERLFYVSPFELEALVKAFRLRQTHRVYELLRAYVQECLDRGGVGTEVLGADPLVLLLRENVIKGRPELAQIRPENVPFNIFETNGIYLLATTTNLTRGRLEILGEQQLAKGKYEAVLLDALLASSAFPGVFRPRGSPEIMPRTDEEHDYIDGGVMDNLPLDGVAQFLHQAAKPEGQLKLIARRPQVGSVPVPHLLFTASLEVDPEPLSGQRLQATCASWPTLAMRARQFSYNKKLDWFTESQRDLRRIFVAAGSQAPWTPLDLEVVTVKPRWLCGTFAFHPMLGFRRAKQAASIAHGCASTLMRLGELQRDQTMSRWAAGWGIDQGKLPPKERFAGGSTLTPAGSGQGRCWFRPDVDCPFSPTRLEKLSLPVGTARNLTLIYELCGRPETHQP